jgi:hypothetical protein
MTSHLLSADTTASLFAGMTSEGDRADLSARAPQLAKDIALRVLGRELA